MNKSKTKGRKVKSPTGAAIVRRIFYVVISIVLLLAIAGLIIKHMRHILK